MDTIGELIFKLAGKIQEVARAEIAAKGPPPGTVATLYLFSLEDPKPYIITAAIRKDDSIERMIEFLYFAAKGCNAEFLAFTAIHPSFVSTTVMHRNGETHTYSASISGSEVGEFSLARRDDASDPQNTAPEDTLFH